MALTNTEKQRRYREKRDSDPQRRSQYLEKKRLRYIQDVAVGKRKHVDQLSSRDQRQQRRTWRKNQKLCRKRKKDNQNLLTPPDSPILAQPHQQSSGAKRREKSRAKCYRDKIKLQEQLREERKKKMMYMKRWLREKEKNTKCSVESPHSRSTKMLRGVKFNFPSKKKRNIVRRSLEFHFVLTEAIKQKYRRGNQQLKRTLSNILSSNIVRKYRCLNRAKMEIGMQNKKIQKRKYSMTQRLNKELKNFFKRDDNSRLTAGVKDTVTRKKVKKQKRILLCSLKELHQKYLDEKKSRISYSSFCKQKPFWVVRPSDRDRETCACKIHENIQFMADALYKKGVINTSNLLLLLKEKSCDIEQMSCMYG